MATVAQVYTIVNEIGNQVLGKEAIKAVDTSSFIALGDKILDSSKDKSVYTNALTDIIGRTIFDSRVFMSKFPSVVRHSFEYGCIMRKIKVSLPQAQPNNSWEIGKEGYKPEFAPIIKPTVNERLFSKITTWEIGLTIPDYVWRTAFHDEMEMASMISACFVAMENAMSLAILNMLRLTRASFMARKIAKKEDFPMGAINLLEVYNTQTNAGLTVAKARTDADFLRWCTEFLINMSKYLQDMSTLFNEEGFERHTPSDLLTFELLTSFATAIKVHLESNTFNTEMLKLPNYNEVSYWQASGLSFSFDDVSKIHIKLDEETTVEQSGVVGVMYDYEALGLTLDERRSATVRNDKDEYTDYFNKSNIGYFNDMSENGIVFYIAEA